jgi:hypothetical protein
MTASRTSDSPGLVVTTSRADHAAERANEVRVPAFAY